MGGLRKKVISAGILGLESERGEGVAVVTVVNKEKFVRVQIFNWKGNGDGIGKCVGVNNCKGGGDLAQCENQGNLFKGREGGKRSLKKKKRRRRGKRIREVKEFLASQRGNQTIPANNAKGINTPKGKASQKKKLKLQIGGGGGAPLTE